MYPSDFGYATDLSNCTLDMADHNYYYHVCGQKYNWTDGTFVSQSPFSDSAGAVVGFYNYQLTGSRGIHPTLLLDSSAIAESGNGTKENPYVLTY